MIKHDKEIGFFDVRTIFEAFSSFCTNSTGISCPLNLILSISPMPFWFTCNVCKSVDKFKAWVAERYYPKHNETDIPITERIFSADFPISLQSSQGIFEIVLFDIPANIKLSKDFITLKIITNKKNKIYTLQVPKESKDLLSI